MILLIVLPYIGIFVYRRKVPVWRRATKRRPSRHRRNYVSIVGYSAADEIEKLNRLKAAGSISEQEYGRMRARLVQ